MKRQFTGKHRKLYFALALSFFAAIHTGKSAHAFDGRACAPPWACELEIAQEPSPTKLPETGSDSVPISEKELKEQRQQLAESIAEQNEYVRTRRRTNHVWNIIFITTGISMTLLATALGAVGSASEKAKARTTITIAIIGAVAAAAQTLASKIPVAKRAGEYARIQAGLVSLKSKVQSATTRAELKSALSEFELQNTKIGEAEAAE